MHIKLTAVADDNTRNITSVLTEHTSPERFPINPHQLDRESPCGLGLGVNIDTGRTL